MFSPINQQSATFTVDLQDGETLDMDYSTTTDSDQFSAMISLSGKNYYIQPSKMTCTQTVCTDCGKSCDFFFLLSGYFEKLISTFKIESVVEFLLTDKNK